VPLRESRRVIGLAAGEARRRILVVDDTRESRLLLSKLLDVVGFEVHEATNGLEAIELWQRWQPDLIFMDQRMPLMDGSEATRLIRAEEGAQRKKRTAIVALTASAFEHEREAILASGADEFVMKPYIEEEIFAVITKTIGVAFHEVELLPHRPSMASRVLLVDDDMINRHILRELLSQLGLEVTEARNGAEALTLLDDTTFDVVLLDIEMPQLDGRETVKAIRARERYRDLPVIAMTAHDRSHAVDGMTDYLGKPIDGPQLAAVLSRVLPAENRRYEKKIV